MPGEVQIVGRVDRADSAGGRLLQRANLFRREGCPRAEESQAYSSGGITSD